MILSINVFVQIAMEIPSLVRTMHFWNIIFFRYAQSQQIEKQNILKKKKKQKKTPKKQPFGGSNPKGRNMITKVVTVMHEGDKP